MRVGKAPLCLVRFPALLPTLHLRLRLTVVSPLAQPLNILHAMYVMRAQAHFARPKQHLNHDTHVRLTGVLFAPMHARMCGGRGVSTCVQCACACPQSTFARE